MGVGGDSGRKRAVSRIGLPLVESYSAMRYNTWLGRSTYKIHLPWRRSPMCRSRSSRGQRDTFSMKFPASRAVLSASRACSTVSLDCRVRRIALMAAVERIASAMMTSRRAKPGRFLPLRNRPPCNSFHSFSVGNDTAIRVGGGDVGLAVGGDRGGNSFA